MEKSRKDCQDSITDGIVMSDGMWTDIRCKDRQEPLKVNWDFLVKCTRVCKDVQGLGKIGNDWQVFGMSLEELTSQQSYLTDRDQQP